MMSGADSKHLMIYNDAIIIIMNVINVNWPSSLYLKFYRINQKRYTAGLQVYVVWCRDRDSEVSMPRHF